MVAYNKDEEIPLGTRVKVSETTAPHTGKLGTVVDAPPGRITWSTMKHNTRMTWVLVDGSTKPFGYYTYNLERIEDMNTRNLVGPKPEPVQEPEFPTPWRADGANILDGNDKVVFRIQFGGYRQGAYRSELPVAVKYALAQEVVKAVNKLHQEADTKSPF